MHSRLAPARLNFNAGHKIRLVDIATGAAGLQPEHRAWLDEMVFKLKLREHYWIDIVGYASKLKKHGAHTEDQSLEYNRELSFQRAAEVAFYLEQLEPSVSEHIRQFAGRGNVDYVAPAKDDSPDERAVEVHVTFAVLPPVPPKEVQQAKPLPGGPRCSKWGVAAPGGATFTLMVGAVGVNVVAFRCLEGKGQTHWYLTPGAGPGVGWSPSLPKLKDIGNALLGSLSYTNMSFTDATAVTAFNFRDLEGATCKLMQAGAGYGPGKLKAYLSLHGRTWYRNKYGEMLYGDREFLSGVDVGGDDLQFGIGASVVGGPLIKVR